MSPASPLALPDLRREPVPVAQRRGVWIHVGRELSPSWCLELAARLSRAHPRLTPLLSFEVPSERPGLVQALRCVAPPAARRPHVRRFFAREKPKLLVMAGTCPALPRSVLERARRKALPVLWIAGAAGAHVPALRKDLARIDFACVPDARTAAALLRCGLAPDRMQVVGLVQGAPDLEAACSAATRLLARDAGLLRGPAGARRAGSLGRMLETRAGRRVEGHFAQRIDGIDALREALGRPEHLLCLGNGPSSESPGVQRVAADRCLRVNSRWRGRGVHEEPDMVFTGNRTSLARSPGAIFGFRNAGEERLLVWRWIRRVRGQRLRYFTFGRHFDWLDEERLGARPTNGAVMLATAVALAPASLTIAGIDVFAHPAGAYPGDAGTPNGYVPVHDREVELRIVRELLARFEGEVVVAGPVLPAALASTGLRGVRSLDDTGGTCAG